MATRRTIGCWVRPPPRVSCLTDEGYLFRSTSGGIGRVAGLRRVDDTLGIEKFNITEHVPNDMVYRKIMLRLLREVGWKIESDELAEIENPNLDNHQTRQYRLIREIDGARKKVENRKGAGSVCSRGRIRRPRGARGRTRRMSPKPTARRRRCCLTSTPSGAS